MSTTNARDLTRVTLTPDRRDLTDGAYVVVLSLLALVGFRTTFGGVDYLLAGIVGILLGVVIAHLARATRQPLVVAAALGALVYFLFGAVLVRDPSAAAGFLPTPETIRILASISIHGWKELLTTLPPVGNDGPLVALPYILGLVSGAVGYTLAGRSRSPSLPLIGPIILLATAILLGTFQPAAQLLQGAGFGIVALTWISARDLRRRPPIQNGSARRTRVFASSALIGATTFGAALIGPHAPGTGHARVVLRNYVSPPFDISAYPSPLVGYRKYTKDANNLWGQTLFTVKGLPSKDFVRIATLDDYDGSVWGATNGTVPTGPNQPLDSFQRVGLTIASNAEGRPITLRFKIAAGYALSPDVKAWLPSAGIATAVQFTGSDSLEHADGFRYNLATNQGILPGGLDIGDTYAVDTIIPTGQQADNSSLPTDAQPFGSPTLSSGAAAFTSAQANQWSKGTTGVAAQLLAVARHLRDDGAYSDGGPGESQYLPGHSLFRLSTDFLDDKQPVGDDEQYAATFALLANQLGMPARVVLGATPEVGGIVKGRDVHTWVEVHLANGTWWALPRSEFMPPDSKTPDKQPPRFIHNAPAAIVPPPNPLRPPSTLDQTKQSSSDSKRTRLDAVPGPGWQIPVFLVTILRWVGPPLLLIAAICVGIVGRKTRRRFLRRTRGPVPTRLSGGWSEIVDQARDLGIPVPVGRTRREDAIVLATFVVLALAFTADEHIFGIDEPTEHLTVEYWRRVDETRRAMTRNVGPWRRLRAAISLRSFGHVRSSFHGDTAP